jgi:hypothetical protein
LEGIRIALELIAGLTIIALVGVEVYKSDGNNVENFFLKSSVLNILV